MTRIAAEEYLDALAAQGIEHLFVNPGTDFAPTIEAYARAARTNRPVPHPMIVPHENAAVGMAHGYTMITGKAQAVMLHTNVGTANSINMLIDASRDRIPMLLSSGRTPFTESGAEGSRNAHIHWAQEMYDQAGMLREIVKWDYEMKRGDQAGTVVDRALEMANTSPQGPVYLSLPREVLGEIVGTAGEQSRPSCLPAWRPRLRRATSTSSPTGSPPPATPSLSPACWAATRAKVSPWRGSRTVTRCRSCRLTRGTSRCRQIIRCSWARRLARCCKKPISSSFSNPTCRGSPARNRLPRMRKSCKSVRTRCTHVCRCEAFRPI